MHTVKNTAWCLHANTGPRTSKYRPTHTKISGIGVGRWQKQKIKLCGGFSAHTYETEKWTFIVFHCTHRGHKNAFEMLNWILFNLSIHICQLSCFPVTQSQPCTVTSAKWLRARDIFMWRCVTTVVEAITHSFFNALFQPNFYVFVILSLHPYHPYCPPSLFFSVVMLFHNLSCCNDRMRQWALWWCLWAEPLRGWDKAKLTSGFGCITVSFETFSERRKKRLGMFLQWWPPLPPPLLHSCWPFPWAASLKNAIFMLQT